MRDARGSSTCVTKRLHRRTTDVSTSPRHDHRSPSLRPRGIKKASYEQIFMNTSTFRSERGNNARVRLKRSCKVRYAVFQGHSVSHSLYSLVHASHAHWYRARLYGPIPCRTSRNACVTTFPNLKLAGGSILDSPATFRRATPELHRKLLGIWNDLTETFCSKGGSFLVVSSAL